MAVQKSGSGKNVQVIDFRGRWCSNQRVWTTMICMNPRIDGQMSHYIYSSTTVTWRKKLRIQNSYANFAVALN